MMKRRWLIFIGILFFSICLQSTFFARVNLFGAPPDLILVIIISHALLYGPEQGLLWGLVGGLFLDLASGGVLGINTFVKAVLGYGVGLLERTVFKDNLLIPAAVIAVATLANEILSFILLTALGWRERFGAHLVFTALPLLLQHLILTVPVYLLMLKGLNKRKQELGSRRVGI